MRQDQWKCMDCNWSGPESEILKDEVFKETRLEPAEWVWHCPVCRAADRMEESTDIFCKHCDEVQVQHDDDLCPECFAEECERYLDSSRGH